MITIFTPTYNRAEYLYELYKTLLQQSCKEFEWLVVDDGSTDNTKNVLRQIQKESFEFDVRVIEQDNGGKHRAINRGVLEAKGEYFFIVDSDDKLKPFAVEKVLQWCNEIDKEVDADTFAGVSGLRETREGIVGGKGYGNFVDATNLERRKYHLGGDKAEVYKTDILKKYPFKEFDGENFLSEETVWNAIAGDGYKIRWYPVVIYECQYLTNGLTDSLERLQLSNFQGFTYQTLQAVRMKDWLGKIRAIGEYARISKNKGDGLWMVSKRLKVSVILVLLSYLLIWFYRKIAMRKVVKR